MALPLLEKLTLLQVAQYSSHQKLVPEISYMAPIKKSCVESVELSAPGHRIFEGLNYYTDLTLAVDYIISKDCTRVEVHPAAPGRVFDVRCGVTKLWNNPEPPPKGFFNDLQELDGNFVVLEHLSPGGKKEYTIYSHLDPESISVKIGQKVSTEDIIGFVRGDRSGTGWSLKPHLHHAAFLLGSCDGREYLKTLDLSKEYFQVKQK